MEVKVQEKIHKPAAEVFDGIVDPQKLSSYFTTAASGPIEEGKGWTHMLLCLKGFLEFGINLRQGKL